MATAGDINLPRSTNFMVNGRDQRLHFRFFLSDLESARSIVFFLHGYTGHSSRPEVQKAAAILTSRDRALFCLEFAGHGYSEGVRALITNHDNLVDDAEGFIRRIMYGKTHNDEDFQCELSADQWKSIQKKHFYIMGQSMGGGVAVFLAQRLESIDRFRGSVLLAPSLSTSMPHWLVVSALENTVGACLPEAEMPGKNTQYQP